MAQGFNMGRYIPPDLIGTHSLNQASGKSHALGSRARKLASEGVLIVRFECPFAIWCTTCQPEQIIGQGVRFNAEKKKVGNYYTTAIWSFRFKHTVCGGWIEVQTDPKNAEYVVCSGGRRRDTGEGKLLEGEVRIGVSEEEKARLEKEGGFGALEKKVEDKREADSQTKRIEELQRASMRDWADPYEKSKLLRREFRIGRRKRLSDEKSGEVLRERYGIGFELMAPEEGDVERAKHVGFGEIKGEKGSGRKPLFGTRITTTSVTKSGREEGKKGKKAELMVLEQTSALQSSLRDNTRNAVDPFLREEKPWQPRTKRTKLESESETVTGGDAMPAKSGALALVGYDSDSS